MTNCFFFIWYFFYGDVMKIKVFIMLFFFLSIFFVFRSFDKKEVVAVDKEKRGIFVSYIEI